MNHIFFSFINIDTLTILLFSNRILKMESVSNSSKVTSKNIKLAMIQYVRSTVLSIPALPSMKEIEVIAQKKRYIISIFIFITNTFAVSVSCNIGQIYYNLIIFDQWLYLIQTIF